MDWLIALRLLGCCLVPVAMSVVFYFLQKKTKFGLIPYKYSQLIIGIIFGGVAIFGTEVGVDVGNGVMANVRDSGPLVAGLAFGGPAGLIAGTIGAFERGLRDVWQPAYINSHAVSYTHIACTLSTFLAGVYAAVLRKYLFEDKRPSWGFGFFIGIIMEVIHLTVLFLTKLNDLDRTFMVIKTVSIPMILANGVAVMLSCMILNLIANKENPIINRYKKLTNQIQFWLLITVLIVFVASTSLVYVIQTNTSYNDAENLIELNIGDVEQAVSETTDKDLLSINDDIKHEVEAFETADISCEDLQYIADLYDVDEICVCIKVEREPGKYGTVIYSSNIESYVNPALNPKVPFYMDDYDQSKEFNRLLPSSPDHTTNSYVQPLRQNSEGAQLRKYSGITLDSDAIGGKEGYVQVGYGYEKFKDAVLEQVRNLSNNRHVGKTGRVIVADKDQKIVSLEGELTKDTFLKDMGVFVSETIDGKEVLKDQRTRYENPVAFTADKDGKPILESGNYMFEQVEEFFVVAAMPTAEILDSRDNVLYLTSFMEVLMFAILFALIYELIMQLVVKNINNINSDLGKIIDGDLEVSLNAKGSDEFVSLSNDINTTVSTMKHYIQEAASRIDKELAFAKSIQASALPNTYPAFPNLPSVDICAKMFTAKEVGGDFYDYYMLDANHIGFLVADVSGKGIPAAMFMMQSKATIKNYAARCIKANEVMENSNNELCKENDAGMFVTCWFSIFDTDTGMMYFSNAGHNPPVLYHAKTKKWEYIKSKAGLVLAGFDGVPYPKDKIQLEPGDRVFLYTDGVTEATRGDKVLYGEDRLINYLSNKGTGEIHEVLEGLKEDIDLFIDGAPQFDDITMLMLEYRGKEEK